MKFNSILFTVLVLLGGCGNAENKPDLSNTAPEKDPLESAVEWSKLQDRNGVLYMSNAYEPFNGFATCLWVLISENSTGIKHFLK